MLMKTKRGFLHSFGYLNGINNYIRLVIFSNFYCWPVIFIAGRPKAALLFWFFGDFRCGALLFMVIHVIYKYKNK